MGWNEGWVQLGTGCGGGRLPDAVLSMMTAGLFGVGPSRVSRSGGNRFTPGLKGGFLPPEVSARLPGLFWTPPGTLLRPQPCAIPENSTTKGINRWCLTTCK